jgi:hypothetical protein
MKHEDKTVEQIKIEILYYQRILDTSHSLDRLRRAAIAIERRFQELENRGCAPSRD